MNKTNPFQNQPFLNRLAILRDKEALGIITGLELFREVKLSRAAVPWKCPFYYRKQDGKEVFEAFKVESDPTFKVIIRLWQEYGPGTLIVTQDKGQGLEIRRTVEPLARINSLEDKGGV